MQESNAPAIDWEDIRHFAALARHRSYAAAARALATTPEDVERRVSHLQVTLGHALFHRQGHTLELNAAGAAALAEAAQMEMAACSLVQLRARRELSARQRTDCTGDTNPRRR